MKEKQVEDAEELIRCVGQSRQAVEIEEKDSGNSENHVPIVRKRDFHWDHTKSLCHSIGCFEFLITFQINKFIF